ncbi:MAG: hypothetical protein J6X38_04075, partial [Abditibacteriota bacterium]|nr:hypothetical protein [Abditibacteriota bacterium]
GTKNTTYNSACTGGSTTSGAATYFAYNTVINVGNVTRVWQNDHVYASNNICVDIRGCNPDAVFTGTASNLTTRNNMIKSYTATNQYQDSGSGNGTDKWNVDPKFGSNYRLSSTSPAINIGTDGSTLLTNCGCSFTGTPDLGCYEFTGTAQCVVSVKVQSNYSGNPAIEGATVTIGSSTATTNANGIATFTLNRGTAYTASVTGAPAHSDGSSASFTPGASEATKTVTVTLTKGNTFYVNFDSGNNAKNGLTAANAWKNVAPVNTWAKAGDTIYVTGNAKNSFGTANGYNNINGINGTAANPILIRPYGSGAVFETTNSDGAKALNFANCSYVTIDGALSGAQGGIEFTTARIGLFLDNCNNFVVKNCNLHNINSGGSAEGTALREHNGSHHNTFVRNLINGVGLAGDGKLNGAFTSGGNPQANSTVFAYNTVIDAGNAVRVWDGRYDSTTTANSQVVAKNNIIYNMRGYPNRASDGATQSGVFHADANQGDITSDNNIIYGYYDNHKYDNVTESATNIWDEDPLFADTTNYTLYGYSPAVDRGNDTSVLTNNGLTFVGYAPDLGWRDAAVPQYIITGVVTSSDGNTPISGATVAVGNDSVTTGADGSYTLVLARPANAGTGTYTVEVSADDHDSDSASVTATSAAPARIVNFALADYIEINNPEDLAAAEAGERVNVTAGLPAFNGSGAFDDNSVYVRTDP